MKAAAKKLKGESFVLYLAARHPKTPWYAKIFAGCVIAYALSPIDLIPDFIPILGYLDDLILVPLGIYVCFKLIPPNIIKECRAEASRKLWEKRTNWISAGVIVSLWLAVGYWLISTLVKRIY